MTGFSNNMNEEKAKSLGIQGFLMKPVALEQLAKTVREVLDRTVKYVGEVSPALLPKSSLTGQFTDTEKSTAAFAAVSLDHPGCNASLGTGEYHEEHGHKKNSGRR